LEEILSDIDTYLSIEKDPTKKLIQDLRLAHQVEK